jgi:hypothetical protein
MASIEYLSVRTFQRGSCVEKARGMAPEGGEGKATCSWGCCGSATAAQQQINIGSTRDSTETTRDVRLGQSDFNRLVDNVNRIGAYLKHVYMVV